MGKTYRFKTKEELGPGYMSYLPDCEHFLETHTLGNLVPSDWNTILERAIKMSADTVNLIVHCKAGQGSTEEGCVKRLRLDLFEEIVSQKKERVSKHFGIASLRD